MYDVIIIGAGSMGMAAGYYLTEAGQKVALIDSDNPPHTEGSHHGGTRLIRHAYGEGSNYVPLALYSQRLWEALAEKTDEQIFLKTGVLNFGPKGNRFLDTVQKSAAEFQLSLEVMTAEEMNTRWPGLQLDEGLIGCYETNSGVLFSENAIRSYRLLAEENGADLYTNSYVQAIDATAANVTVKINDNRKIIAKKLLITAGKGTNQVTKLLQRTLPLTPVRKTFSWFKAEESIYKEGAFPAWSYADDNSTYYGFPSIDEAGVKIGRHDQGHPLKDARKLDPFGTYSEDEQETLAFAQKHFSVDIQRREGRVCTYTNTPDENFIIDYLPGYSNVVAACGFSGHGFKFSSGIGESLARILTGRKPVVSLESFHLNRFK